MAWQYKLFAAQALYRKLKKMWLYVYVHEKIIMFNLNILKNWQNEVSEWIMCAMWRGQMNSHHFNLTSVLLALLLLLAAGSCVRSLVIL